MNTITLCLKIETVMELLTNNRVSQSIRNEIKDCVISAWTAANPTISTTSTDSYTEPKMSDKYMNLTLKTVNPSNRVHSIAAVRHHLGWSLKEAKDLVDAVLGKPKYYGDAVYATHNGGSPQTITGFANEVLKATEELRALGCEVVTDTYFGDDYV